MSLPRLVLTAGEPAGIGPDLCVQLAQRSEPRAQIVVLSNAELLQQRAAQLGLPLRIVPFDPQAPAQPHHAGTLSVWSIPLVTPVQAGRLDTQNAEHVLQMLRSACDGCLAGQFAALVTAPLHKGVINDAGVPFSGHTEFFAERCGGQLPVMMLACPGLRVALATTHLPLSQVPAAITPALLREVLSILQQDLRTKFGLTHPRILVCGLNPHAGEGGHLGREELEIIGPTLEQLRSEGLQLIGPLPADTLFTPRHLQHADAVLAMYHDQGLPVLKYKGFGQAVNITLGLPIIRTSVDHGTALDLAGSGRADVGSLLAAIECALEMVQAQEHDS